MTHGLEGRCSVQLSYGRQGGATRAVGRIANPVAPQVSGRSDLNRGPPAPKAGALTGLRYAPHKTRRELKKLTATRIKVNRTR